MKSFYVLLFCVFLSSAFLFSSCNNLSRGKAKKLVLSNIKTDDLVIQFETDFTTGRIRKEPRFGEGVNLDNLINEGYLKLDGDKNHVILTDKVLPFTQKLNVMGTLEIWISVANFSDVKITGIIGNDKFKKVEYKKIFKLNSLGQEINYNTSSAFNSLHKDNNGDIFYNTSTKLTKYDDGWR
jgi:hypothetical protein